MHACVKRRVRSVVHGGSRDEVCLVSLRALILQDNIHSFVISILFFDVTDLTSPESRVFIFWTQFSLEVGYSQLNRSNSQLCILNVILGKAEKPGA